jgi:hypothetical protein
MPKAPESAELELLAAAGLLGNNPTVDAITRMHQSRMHAQGIPPQYPALGQSLEPGNIDLTQRKPVPMPGGGYGTVKSMGVNINGQEVLIPTISPDGRLMSQEEAIQQYLKTGQHLGKFRTPEESTAAGQRIHESEAKRIGEF